MKLAIITGSSRGLGLAITQHLLTSDWNVLGLSRSTPKEKLSSNYTHLSFDLADLNAPETLIQKLKSMNLTSFSEIFFIHNASAFWPVGLLPNLKADEIQK